MGLIDEARRNRPVVPDFVAFPFATVLITTLAIESGGNSSQGRVRSSEVQLD